MVPFRVSQETGLRRETMEDSKLSIGKTFTNDEMRKIMGDFWSYCFPLGILEDDNGLWEQVEFIFFDEGRIHAETCTFGRYSEGARRDAESRRAQREALHPEVI